MNLSREQLYEKVWTTPIDRLAAEFGVSGVALGKTCRRMNIPVPPRGYWARVAAGQRPRTVPLPPGPPQFDGSASSPPDVKGLEFPADCSGLHPVAREVRVGLRAATPDNESHLIVGGQTTPHVRVTKTQIDRAARALHFILMLLEARGSGYPEPSADGAFDAQAVPLGGPYPHNREFSRPPTMPDITNPQREPSYGYSSYDAPAPKPYPFWLKYQKH